MVLVVSHCQHSGELVGIIAEHVIKLECLRNTIKTIRISANRH